MIIAVRGGPTAKSRLAHVLNAEQRKVLVEAMLFDMLEALQSGSSMLQCYVITPTLSLAALAEQKGATVVSESQTSGLNTAFERARAMLAVSEDKPDIALLPGDLPTLALSDVLSGAALVRAVDVALAPTKDGGTGALFHRAGAHVPITFGEQSFERHREKALACSFSLALFNTSGLAFDIDLPEDLVAARQSERATRTRGVLAAADKFRIEQTL